MDEWKEGRWMKGRMKQTGSGGSVRHVEEDPLVFCRPERHLVSLPREVAAAVHAV